MNSTQNNNSNPLTSEEINNLQGEDLKNALDQKLKGYKDEITRIDAAVKDICEDVESRPNIDTNKTYKEDTEALGEIEEKLDTELSRAAVELATEDEILKDLD